jgi:hypothetical protein
MPSIGAIAAGVFFLFIAIWMILTFTNVMCNDMVGLCFKKAQPVGKEGACTTCPVCVVSPSGPSGPSSP